MPKDVRGRDINIGDWLRHADLESAGPAMAPSPGDPAPNPRCLSWLFGPDPRRVVAFAGSTCVVVTGARGNAVHLGCKLEIVEGLTT